ncbi:MAG: hypothetical protein PF450_13475 [Bacteroidales bacterium]|jgi:hypothetical protein|nr:hypothetical protein [Bacteroidales bacterium]
MKKLIFIFLLTILFGACTKEDFIDIFIGGQPTFYEEDNFDKQLNVFTILQPDNTGGFSKSVFELSRTRMALNDTLNDSILLSGAIITLLKIQDQASIDSLSFTYYYPDSLVFDPLSDPNASFRLEELYTYSLEISCEGFSNIYAKCIPPVQPILASEVSSEGETISFSLKNDSSIYLYEVFLVYSDKLSTPFRIEAQNDLNETMVFIENSYPEKTLQKKLIYSYDKNLSTYYSFSNVFIKPNTYRPPFTTLEGGYGCFGAINELVYTW